MKVELLEEIGLHKKGAIIDIDDTIIMRLERDGLVRRFVEQEQVIATQEVPKDSVEIEKPKRKGNPNWGKKK